MSNEMILLDNATTKVNLPSYFGSLFGDDTNLKAAASTPQLSIRGKMFRIVLDGEETIMTRPNPDTGESENVSTIKLIILNQGERGARAYYDKAYDGSSTAAPACFSLDGKTPDASATAPQASSCATCPHSVKGSKVTPTGHATTSCALQRRLAVVPANRIDFTPLLLRLAATSAWDKENKTNEAGGWYAWQQYNDFLAARGIRHTAQVVTMVKFDNTEYPKLLFKAERVLTEAEAGKVVPLIHSEAVLGLLTSVGDDRGSFDAPVVAAPAPVVAAPAPVVAAPAPVVAAPAPVVAAPAPVVAAPAPAPVVQSSAQIGSALDDLLAGFDD